MSGIFLVRVKTKPFESLIKFFLTWQVCDFLDLEAVVMLEDEEEVFEEGEDLSDSYSLLWIILYSR